MSYNPAYVLVLFRSPKSTMRKNKLIYFNQCERVQIISWIDSLTCPRICPHPRRIKHCKIVRTLAKFGYDYYLQLVLDGNPPLKLKTKQGTTAFDPGTRISAFYGDNVFDFVHLAPNVRKFNKLINDIAKKYTRLQSEKNRHHLAYLYQQRKRYRVNQYGHLTNEITKRTSVLKLEPMNYKKLIEDGLNPYNKDKRKKGMALNLIAYATSVFEKMQRKKVIRYGGTVIVINSYTTKSSQYNHVTGKCEKTDLSQRTKIIGNCKFRSKDTTCTDY